MRPARREGATHPLYPIRRADLRVHHFSGQDPTALVCAPEHGRSHRGGNDAQSQAEEEALIQPVHGGLVSQHDEKAEEELQIQVQGARSHHQRTAFADPTSHTATNRIAHILRPKSLHAADIATV